MVDEVTTKRHNRPTLQAVMELRGLGVRNKRSQWWREDTKDHLTAGKDRH